MDDIKSGIIGVQSKDFHQMITSWMGEWRVPGCAVAVIKEGKVVLSQGYGHRDIDKNLPVDENTLFAIGSTSKAFTAASIAILADQGRIGWDVPIQKYMQFALQDEEAARRMTVVDLLSHRSGLPRHDAVWYGTALSRREVIDRLKYLAPSADFRAAFQYQNLMFTAAGYLLECITGETWEAFTRRFLLDPLEMTDTNFSVEPLPAHNNAARPYLSREGKLKEMPYRNIDAISPAGGINSNLRDLAAWLQIHLDEGRFKDRQIVSAQNLRMTHTAATPIASSFGRLLQAFDEIGDESYALGWFTHKYRGQTLFRHGGHIDGFSTQISFMPALNAGVIVLTNVGGSSFMYLPTFLVYDLLLDKPPIDWHGRIKKAEQVSKLAIERAGAWYAQQKQANKAPSHALKEFAGNYSHPAYGEIRITHGSSRLKAAIKGRSFDLRHYHHNVFNWLTSRSDTLPIKLTFQTDTLGQITSLELPLEPNVAPLVFVRQGSAEMTQDAYLDQFTGLYDWQGKEAAIAKAHQMLRFAIPGLGSLTLSPRLTPQMFDVLGKPNWLVEFSKENGAQITSVSIITPSGLFSASRIISAHVEE